MQGMKSFHLPLPEDLYNELRNESARSKRPATELARQAIKFWIEEQKRKAVYQSVAEFASEYAGTGFDLDEDLEAAGIEFLLQEENK